MMTFLTFLKFLAFLIFAAHGLKMIPESLKISYTNEKYMKEVVVNIRRFTRNGDYFLNFYGEIKHTWANNITVNIVVTQFLHNEYRRSFIEFHYRFCDMVNKEPMFGEMLKQKGVVCPAPKGQYSLSNITVQSQEFPNVWPFEKGGVDVNVTLTETGVHISMGYMHMKFENLKKKGQYRLSNMTVQSQNFPNVWPFEKGGADVNVTLTDTGELIAMGYVHLQFKNFKKKI